MPPLEHIPDEDAWNEENHCKYWVAGSGAFVQIRCKVCGSLLENRMVTATHNYVPTRVVQYTETYEAPEGYEGSTMMYECQEYECTNCGKTYLGETLKRYIYENGGWVEF